MPRLDPHQSARDHRGERRDARHERNQQQRQRHQERRARRAERLAEQPDQTSPMETVDALPDPTAEYLGRSLVQRTPGGFRSVVNTAIQLSDDTVVWREMVQADLTPTYTFLRTFGGVGAADGFTWQPKSVDCANDGTVWVSDAGNHRIKHYTATGGVIAATGAAGTGAGSFGGASASNYPTGTNPMPEMICVRGYDQSVWATDSLNKRVTAFNYLGGYADQWDEVDVPVVFQSIYGIRWSTAGARFLLTDYAFDEVMFFDANFTFTGSITPGGGAAAGQLDFPADAISDSVGNIYISEWNNFRISKWSAGGAFLGQWGSSGSGDGFFNRPRGLAIDGADRLYVADTQGRIQVFSAAGTFITKFGASGSGAGQFSNPLAVAVSATGLIYVADYGNSRISVWQMS